MSNGEQKTIHTLAEEAAAATFEALTEPVLGVINALRVYLTARAKRDEVETRLMELELAERCETKSTSGSPYGYHEKR